VEENGEPVIYVVLDGVRIAKRGKPDTPQARTWISIEPGYVVRDGRKGPGKRQELLIEYQGVRLH
jgi:hypothetical protein